MTPKIVVPLDGSQLALESLPFALKLAHLWNGQLCLLTVVPPQKENLLYDWSHEAPVKQKLAAQEFMDNLVKGLTGSGENQLPANRVYAVVAESYMAGQAIAGEALNQEADYIAMTTHGRSGITELLLGSTALEVIRNSSLPVIFLRPTWHQAILENFSGTNLKSYKKLAGPVVVALDGSPEAELSLNSALDMAEQLDLPVHLLRVIPPFVPVDELASWYEANLDRGNEYLRKHDFEQVKEEAARYLEKVAERIDLQNLNGKIGLKVGEAVSEIIDYATEEKASFIVLATHAHGRVEQALLGSVASQVLCHSGIPVVMINIALASSKAKAKPVR